MHMARRLLIGGVVAVMPALALANGFALFENGARAVGMAGAFVATADDPSAGYYNPAGLAFLEGTQFLGGFYLITETSEFTGDDPYPGAGYKAKMEDQIFYPLHGHMAGHLGGNFHYGVSFYSPFGLGTWWPDDYAGRYITKRIDLKVFNLNPNIAYRLGDRVAIAVGADLFISQVDLTKGIGVINPYTQQVDDVGQVHLYSTEWETALGYNAAFLAKLGAGFSFGASYRSEVEMEYTNAEASFIQYQTGYPDFDAIVAGLLPFAENVPGQTLVTYPEELRFGIAWSNEKFTLAYDAVQVGWSSFAELPITIEGRPDLSSVREEDYEDKTTHRFGFEHRVSPTFAYQLGYLYDPTPVPTASVSPLLPDADRDGYSVGFSWDMSKKIRVDSSFLYLPFEERSTEGQDHDNFNGTYDTKAYLFGVSLTYRF
ncbi:MAG: outer membrane protein transport protein [Acidobacteriota bacterium]